MGRIAIAYFSGRDGYERRIEFSSDSYSGPVTEPTLAAGGVTVEEDNSEEQLKPLRPWTGRISVINTGADLSNMIAKHPHDIQVLIIRDEKEDEVIEYFGFVGVESRTQPWPGDLETVDIPIVSPLYTAGGYHIDKSAGQDFTTLGALMEEALILCGYKDFESIRWPSRYSVDRPELYGLDVLAMEISRGRFFTEKSAEDAEEGETGWQALVDAATAETLLTEICKLFGYTIHDGGNGPSVTMAGVTDYVQTTIRNLSVLDGSEIWPDTSGTHALDDLAPIGTDHTVDYLSGRKEVAVTVEQSPADGNLLPGVSDGRKLVNHYDRYILYANAGEGVLKTGVYEATAESAKGVITAIPYTRQSVTPGEDFTKGWEPGNTDTLRGWDYTTHVVDGVPNTGSKPGCFHARIFDNVAPWVNVVSPPTDYSAYKEFPREPNGTDGYIFNPAYDETGTRGYIGAGYDILTIQTRASRSYEGGYFVLDFSVGCFPIATRPDNGRTSMYPNANIRVDLTVGGKPLLFEKGPYLEPNKFVRLNRPDSNTASFPAGAHAVTPVLTAALWQGPQSLLRVRDGGAETVRIPKIGEEGSEGPLTGPINIRIRISPRLPGGNRYMLYFISGISLTWHPDDDEHDEWATGGDGTNAESGRRELRRQSANGFSDAGVSVSLMMASDGGRHTGDMSALMYGGRPLTGITDNLVQGEPSPPENQLLERLAEAYDRVTERLTVYVDDRKKVTAGDIVQDGAKRYAVEAVGEDYYNGSKSITLIEII